MPKTLVTGVNGFVAAHVVDSLIKQGHEVTGSVRSLEKSKDIFTFHPEWEDKLSFVEVSDYTAAGVWDKVFQDGNFDYVVHVAAPLLDDPKNTDFERDFLRPGVQTNVELLQSAATYGKNVKAISITGSINAITTGAPEEIKTRDMTVDAWNFVTKENAIEAQNAYISYVSSKKEAELAVWDFVKTQKPHFSVNVFLPALIFGPPIQPLKSLKSLNYSSNVFYSLWNGTYEVLPPTSFPSYIDVRDLADAQVKSLTTPEAANRRLLIGGHDFAHRKVAEILRKIPEIASRVPKDSDEVTLKVRLDPAETDKILGLKYHTAEETFTDAAKRILELEKQFA